MINELLNGIKGIVDFIHWKLSRFETEAVLFEKGALDFITRIQNKAKW